MSGFKIFTVVSLFILAGALAGGFWYLQQSMPQITSTTQQVQISPTPSPLPVTENDQLSQLQASISGLVARIEDLEQEVAKEPVTSTTTGKSTAGVRTETLYVGSSDTQSREWKDTGVEIEINSADYPANATATYQAGLSIIGGEAWSRLKNKTSGAIISASEVSSNTDMLTWKTSGSFKLFPGKNTYTIEMRSTSGEIANLSGARIVLNW